METKLKETIEFNHSTKGKRIGAYLIDMLIILLVVLPVNYMNITEFKSFSLYLLLTLAGVVYKPLMEHYFQATVGKFLLDLKVTDLNGNRIGLSQSFLRSLILIIPSILLIPIQYLAFNNPEINIITSFMDFSAAVVTHYPIQNTMSNLISIVIVADVIFMFKDKKKMNRSLHDRIGKTYVLDNK